MYKYIILFICLFAINHVKSQQNTIAENSLITKLMIDPKMIPAEKAASRIITVWDSLNVEENNNYAFTKISIKTWEKLFIAHYQNIAATKNENLLLQLKYTLAIIYFESANTTRSLELLKELHNRKDILPKQQITNVLVKLEEIYRDLGEMAEAIAIRKERMDYGFKGNFWAIYRDCGLIDEAIEDFRLFETIPVTYNINYIKYNYILGELYFQNKQFDSAIKYYKSGLEITNKVILNNKKTSTEQLLNFWRGCFTGLIAKYKMQKGEISAAIPMLIYDISYSDIDQVNKLNKMILLSKCYLLSNDFKNAKKVLDAINAEFSDLNINRNKTKIPLIKYKSEYFNKIKQYDSAYFYLDAYSNLMDIKNKNVKKNQSALLLIKLETSKRREELKNKILTLKISEEENKNKSIKILKLSLVLSLTAIVVIALGIIIRLKNKNKNKLTIKNALLEDNIKENQEHILKNELLLKELHHRVKNNLQLMYSLLNLQKRRNDDIEIKNNLSTIQNRIQTMALVHEYLYNSGNFESVEAYSYIQTLASHLKVIYKQEHKIIKQNINIELTIQLPIEQIISLGLIVNEILSNAYKYAFNDDKGTKIKILLVQINKLIILEISDDGPGFSKSQIKEDSLGLKLIEIMCAQIKATLKTSTTNGVKYIIEFKI